MFEATLNFQTPTKLNLQAKTSIQNIMKAIHLPQRPRVQSRPKKLRVLSIDGGGIRAILPAMILAELEAQLQRESGNPEASIVNYFDLFAGTSAGAILTALYISPSEDNPRKPKFTAQQVLEIYLRDGCKSFAKANPDASKARREKYCAQTLEEKLQFLLGENTTMKQLMKPAFFTAFNTATELPVYFESWKQGDCKVWQATRASSAAPGLFPAAIVEGFEQEQSLIDGSIFASNPAMCAYALANNTCFSELPNCAFYKDFPTTDEMTLLSLGTGKEAKSTDNNGSWLRSMMKNLMSSGTELVDFQLKQLFGGQGKGDYYRFNPCFPDNEGDIDNVGKAYVDFLLQLGQGYLNANRQSINNFIQTIL